MVTADPFPEDQISNVVAPPPGAGRMAAATISAVVAGLFSVLSPKQLASLVLAPRYRIALWVGAVSAGKTFVSSLAFVLAVRKAPTTGTIVMLGKTLRTIEDNVLSQMMDEALFGQLAKYVQHTPGATYAIILGRRVQLIGAPNKTVAEKIRGGTYCLGYVDEATLIPYEAWKMLLTRFRTKDPHLFATTNPGSKNHWLRLEYILNPVANDMVVFHLTMMDNPSLPAAYIRWQLTTNVGVFFQRYILGLWTNAEGAIYPHFDERRHVIPWHAAPPISQILCVGIDHGTTNATALLMLAITDERDASGRPAPRLLVLDELSIVAKSGQRRPAPSEQAEEVRKWLDVSYRHHPGDTLAWPRFVFVDPAAAGFFEQLRRSDIPNLAKADNDVSKGITDVSSLLAKGRLIITDRCPQLLRTITEYSWDPKKTEKGDDEPLKVDDHWCDALRYAVRTSKPLWESEFRRVYGLAA